jgi:hypothetical protein
LGTLCLDSLAHATASSRLVYARGQGTEASCPDEAALRQAVVKRVGYDPFFPFAKFTVTASLKRDGGKLTGHVELVGEDGIGECQSSCRFSVFRYESVPPASLLATVS